MPESALSFVSCNRVPILIRLQKTLIRSGAVRIRVISDIEIVLKGHVELSGVHSFRSVTNGNTGPNSDAITNFI